MHIFSRDRVHADEDVHPTITDEICIDSKIKSNEKKIGSQPDPTVPDCCIEVAERHFFYCLQISINDIELPHPPIISLNRRSDLRSFTKLIIVIVSCISGKPSCFVKGKDSFYTLWDPWSSANCMYSPPVRSLIYSCVSSSKKIPVFGSGVTGTWWGPIAAGVGSTCQGLGRDAPQAC